MNSMVAYDPGRHDQERLSHEATSFDPGRLVRALRRWWPLLVAFTVVAAAGGYYFEWRKSDVYEAEVAILVQPAFVQTVPGSDPRANTDPERELATEAVILASADLRQAVSDEIGQDISYSVDVETDTDILVVSARAGDADRAARAADGIADIYLRERSAARTADLDAARASYEQLLDDLEQRLEELDADLAAAPDDAALSVERQSIIDEVSAAQATVAALGRQRITAQTGARQVATAEVPGSPVSPNPERGAVLFGLVGLLAGLTMVRYLQPPPAHAVDTTHEDPEERAALDPGVPWFLLPEDGKGTEAEHAGVFDLIAERLLAGPRVVLVTGVTDSHRLAAVGAGIAMAVSHRGLRTVLVAGNLADTTVDQMFGADDRLGLSDVADGTAVEDVLEHASDDDNLAIVPSGRRPNGVTSLDSERVAAALGWLDNEADLTIVVGPSITADSDASFLANRAGLTMLVAPVGCPIDRVFEASSIVETAGGSVGGVIVDPAPGANGWTGQDARVGPTAEALVTAGATADTRVEPDLPTPTPTEADPVQDPRPEPSGDATTRQRVRHAVQRRLDAQRRTWRQR